jgi:hypothetical protein
MTDATNPTVGGEANLFAELAQAETEMFRKAMNLPDWHYRDLPQMAPASFDQFVELCGADNLKWITLAERQWPSGNTTKRGQVMISPEGMMRIAEHNASAAITKATGADQ